MGSGKGSALRDLGLGEADERVYGALLRRRAPAVPDAAQLCRELGLTRGELARALARLREHGFTLPETGGPGGTGAAAAALPRPVPPAPAVRALIHRRQAELHSRAAELERLRRQADEIAEHLDPAPAVVPGALAGVEAVSGPRAIVRHVDQLLAGAEKEVLILDRPPYLNPWAVAGADPGTGIAALLERGVSVRVVLAREGLALPGRTRLLGPLVDRGLGVRVAADVPTKLIAVDGRDALLPPAGGADPTRAAVVVRDTLLQHVFRPLFEALWERALPLGGGGPRLSEEHRDLLGLLAGGFKDEAIARRLGVHVHTARRRISRLLDELGADTRFQAGAQAALRGWLAGS
ncbi:hypothetical protein AT728_32745 [Streptomyces silvensis]|uniref:HTH luxR-type domain-containing protein n=2 Tax=Streptomyces silvensis TaxID=1765722 RepID=A0A0W7WSD9_9ACTN|nr:hypothetical protein [Streptomyces silvensis]KUF13550.1 hypothetical protein AT728_32745 [Streptomyces silvensis]